MKRDVNISDELLDECQKLIYRKWAEAHDNLKAVKAETNDGTPDWNRFHAHRLSFAINDLARYKSLLDEINPLAPLTRNL